MNIAQIALAAEYYQMPLGAYLDHQRTIRERYGEQVARLDLSFALGLRRRRIERQNEAARKAASSGPA